MNATLAAFVRALGRVEEPHAAAVSAEQTTPNPVLMRFLTHGGAVVAVTLDANQYPIHCSGCDWTHDGYTAKRYARDAANKHASECRSMPKPTA